MYRTIPGILLLVASTLASGCTYDMDAYPYEPDNVSGVTVSTLAGTGTQGASDGPAGSVATFRGPTAVAVHASSGKAYVADSNNHLIREITKDEVKTYAGTGKPGEAVGTRATAQFKFPTGVAVGVDGKVYVADTGNNRVVVISGDTVSVLAGSGKAGTLDGGSQAARFWGPRGIVVDSTGMVFVADSLNHRVRVIQTNGQVATLCGKNSGIKGGFADGTLDDAKFLWPIGLALNKSSGTLIVADSGNHRIREVDSTNKVVRTLAGKGGANYVDGSALSAQFNAPLDVARDSQGRIYVAGEKSHRIRRIYKGSVTTIAGSGQQGYGDGPAREAKFNSPSGLSLDPAGRLLIADPGNHRIRSLTP